MRLLSCLVLLAAAGMCFADEPWKLDDKFKALKPEDLKDAASSPAPKGAIVLFDGKNIDAWTKKDSKAKVEWKLADGTWEGVKGHGDILTKEKFDGKFKLHLEFRVPYEPGGSGQGKGNSGVYVQGRYEVQVLDSYGLKSGKNDCGAIYNVAAPKENVCKAPTVWQTYDIEFTSPKCENGKKSEPARMTVYHNGVKIHDNVEIPVDNTTSGLGGDVCTPGPILLQDHGHPVQYRNIWLLK
jgi:rubredoxin